MKSNKEPNENRLDEAGSALLREARATDDEVEAAASSPFLYARIQAAIAEQKERANASNGRWLSLLARPRLAIPAMALAAICAVSLPLLAGGAKRAAYRPQGFVNEESVTTIPVAPGDLTAVTVAASACALSNNQECAISDNEVLATIFAEENQEKQR
ncbi:MAG TPA: hypothetical protein VG778_07275 [Blastocatellia bacterium]|jgi:hypothetical protein|nr:hypothetical protein [Blastocatellia bacterium]